MTLVRLVGGCLAVAALLSPSSAAACAIDNTASLSVDAVRATLNTAAPTSGHGWAPFVLAQAVGAGRRLQLAENRSELARTLKPATVAAPYRWSFGDGTATQGHAVTHTYARPGTYRVVVAGEDVATGEWFTFDSVLVHVVSPAQLGTANLGYRALTLLDTVASAGMWLIDTVLVALALAGLTLVVRPHWTARRRRARQGV